MTRHAFPLFLTFLVITFDFRIAVVVSFVIGRKLFDLLTAVADTEEIEAFHEVTLKVPRR